MSWIYPTVAVMLIVIAQNVNAIEFTEPTSDEIALFERILEPIMKIYNLAKYVLSAIAAVVLLVAGGSFMMAGSDPRKRDNAKGLASYVVIGLVVMWGSPYVIQYLT